MFKFLTAFVEVATDLLMGGKFEQALKHISRARNVTLPSLARIDQTSTGDPSQFGAEAAALLSQMEVCLMYCLLCNCS